MQTLKKSLPLIIIIMCIISYLQVYAYGKIEKNMFYNTFPQDLFTVSSTENKGLIASRKYNPDFYVEDSYEYIVFENSKKAKKHIIDIYNHQIESKNIKVDLNDEYNILKNKSDDYSLLKYDYSLDSISFYVYYYQYDNVVLLGTVQSKDKKVVDENINKILSMTSSNKDNKKEDVNIVKYVIIGLFIVLLIIFIILISIKMKKRDK